jgi:cell division protein FtsW (lipid II flippase)
MGETLLYTIAILGTLVSGLFNIYTAIKRMRAERSQGQQTPWHRQQNLLLGVGMTLLSLMLFLAFGTARNVLSTSTPLYILIGALFCLLVFFLGRALFFQLRGFK